MEARVTYGITAVTLLTLFIIVFFVIPKYVPADQQEDATHWSMVAYSALLFLMTSLKTEFDAMSISMVILFILIIALQTSGVYWWIPKYVSAGAQANVTHWMIIGSSMAILLMGVVFTPVWKQGISGVNLIGDISSGGRRRR
uniref:Uncharacterized protein n=1 Tax=viral metagenome TaxID=1070528 RepID=A0A6C0KCZ6_9ZZZZ